MIGYLPATAALVPRYASWLDATGVIPTMYALSGSIISGKNDIVICDKIKNQLVIFIL